MFTYERCTFTAEVVRDLKLCVCGLVAVQAAAGGTTVCAVRGRLCAKDETQKHVQTCSMTVVNYNDAASWNV